MMSDEPKTNSPCPFCANVRIVGWSLSGPIPCPTCQDGKSPANTLTLAWTEAKVEIEKLRATIDRQAAEMQAREASYMDALAAKSIRIDEQATLIESLQTEIERLRAGAIPEDVRETLLDGIAIIEEQTNNGHPLADTERARHWLESQPTATDKACSACGKRGKIFGEVLDDKDERIKHQLCGKCCQMWDNVDTKDDVWSAICVRRNSGAYVVISPPPEVKP